LHLSRRGVYYLLRQINRELTSHHLDEISNVHNIGYFMTQSSKKTLKNYNKKEQEKPSTVSKQQRQTLIFWELINGACISINDIVTEYNVSNHTAIADLTAIKQQLKKRNLDLTQTTKGKLLTGSEVSIRTLVLEQLNDSQSLIYGLIDPDPDKINFIQNQLHELEQVSKNYFSDDALLMISEFTLWLINRLSSSKYLLTKRSNSLKITNQTALAWAKNLLIHYDIVNEFEAAFLTQIINASQFYKVNKSDELIRKIEPITRNVIDKFNNVSGSNIPPYKLETSLSTHLLSTFYRATFGIKYTHPNLHSFIQNYHELFIFTKMAIQPFEEFVNTTLSDDEIALIAVYFGGQLRDINENTDSTPDVLLVCSSGIGTSVLLKNQLSQRYPTFNFSQPLSVFQFKNFSLKNVKLVISTIHLDVQLNIPVLLVSPILTNDDIAKIDRRLAQTQANPHSSSMLNANAIIDIISDYVRIEDVSGLNSALNNYLDAIRERGKKVIDPKINTTLTKLITENHITFQNDPTSWQSSIKKCFAPLQADHIITTDYAKRIIDLTNEKGPYMHLGNGVFLAHATPNDGVNELGISLFIAEKPISVMVDNFQSATINIIIGLAPIDQQSHLNALAQLLQKLQNTTWLQNLKNATNKDEVLRLLMDD
jgi:transcriptional antiterminator/mannitol/fructose-specific phosphotransferase system IIA component (Ntr-type)